MHRVGFIYALSNPAHPGLVKVGKTSKPNARVRDAAGLQKRLLDDVDRNCD